MSADQQPTALDSTGHANAHTHLYSGLVPLGMPAPKKQPTNFIEILERVWWRLDRALDEDSLRASAELYISEALSAGTTSLIDHHESPSFIEGSLDVIAEVCENLGMAALLTYGITERNGGVQEAKRGLAENERFLQRCAAKGNSGLRGAVGLHASFTLCDGSIRQAAELAQAYNAPLHIHVAEDLADVQDAQRRGFKGVIDRLDQLGALLPGAILAHGVHLDRDEVALVSERGCWLVQNPRSNRGNGVGYPQHLAACSRVALGTDGYASDMLEEARCLAEDARTAESQGLGGELAASAERLAASARLARELFGDRPAPSAPTPEVRDGILRIAKQEAALLWARMADLE